MSKFKIDRSIHGLAQGILEGDQVIIHLREGTGFPQPESPRTAGNQEAALRDLVREIRSSDPDPARFDYRVLERAEEFISPEPKIPV